MEIGIITPERVVAPFLRLVGAEHESSEMVGVVFDPSGTRMYFGSQRAYPAFAGTPAARGAIYEVTGPFRLPPGGVPPEQVYGPPAGEQLTGAIPDPASVPGLRIKATHRAVKVELDAPAEVRVTLRTAGLESKRFERWAEPRPVLTTLARQTASLAPGEHDIALQRLPVFKELDAMVVVEARAGDGLRRVAAAPVRLA
jgi:hypothetical protein